MEKYKKSHTKKNKFKTLAPTWNQEFELLDGSYSVANIMIILVISLKKT